MTHEVNPICTETTVAHSNLVVAGSTPVVGESHSFNDHLIELSFQHLSGDLSLMVNAQEEQQKNEIIQYVHPHAIQAGGASYVQHFKDIVSYCYGAASQEGEAVIASIRHFAPSIALSIVKMFHLLGSSVDQVLTSQYTQAIAQHVRDCAVSLYFWSKDQAASAAGSVGETLPVVAGQGCNKLTYCALWCIVQGIAKFIELGISEVQRQSLGLINLEMLSPKNIDKQSVEALIKQLSGGAEVLGQGATKMSLQIISDCLSTGVAFSENKTQATEALIKQYGPEMYHQVVAYLTAQTTYLENLLSSPEVPLALTA